MRLPSPETEAVPDCCRKGLYSCLLPLGLFGLLCLAWPRVIKGEIFTVQWAWVPSLDLNLALRLDGLSLLFGLIITMTGFFVTVYASSYMAGHPYTGRFFAFLHAFMLAMLGIVFADNLLLMFICWEATTVLSFMLIGFDHEKSEVRENARQALLVTGAGGLFLLMGILLLKSAGVPMTLSVLSESADVIRNHALYPAVFICFMVGAMTKSGQVPFHFWLPNAMSAPTPISAFLHAATMVKAGIYLLMRLHPVMGGTTLWMSTLVLVGGTTALWGAIQALRPCDLKRILAYTTLMALGILTLFLGGRTVLSLTAATTFLMVHALYKAALFLAVGSIDHQTGTRDLNHLGGLVTRMPLTALAVAGATLSMAGFPLFFGFIGKEIMYAGALAENMFPLFATGITLSANALMTAVAGIILITPFFGTLPAHLKSTCETPWTMRIGPAFMGMLGVMFGIMPEWVSQHLIQPAVFAFHPDREDIRLSVFHGINLPLVLSVITLTSGAVIYWQKARLRQGIAGATDRLWINTPKLYQAGLTLFLATAAKVTRTLQNGSLSVYLSATVLTLALVTGIAWLPHIRKTPGLTAFDGPWIAVGLFGFILAATAVVVTARHRLSIIGGLGGVGGGVALIFLVFGAPDIALTQLLVETLTLVFVSLILLRLPPLEKLTGPGKLSQAALVRNAGLSIGTGVIITTLLLGVTATPLDRTLTTFFETASFAEAHGRNIVNVILVDFRSLDTFGEICVVVLAAWAGADLIRRSNGRRDEK